MEGAIAPAAGHHLPPLVTIHGINSNGAWQETLRPVFAPHFRCFPIYYRHYRFFGATKILVEPLVLVATSVAFAVALAMGTRPGVPLLAAGASATLLAAYLAARLRRRSAFVAVLRQFDSAGSISEKRFMIAHSFGTYLCGRLLQRRTTRCSRLIFAGSVLSREFPTKRLPQQDPMPFEEIRNETGLSDRVVKLAGFLRRLVPDMGDAGIRGFASDGVHVHDLDLPDQRCGACDPPAPRPGWVIHNVKLEAYAHSDQFITPRHAMQFWLPTLWGIDVPEFLSWLELCEVASRAGQSGHPGNAAPMAEKLLIERRWSWADGTTIRDFIVRVYPSLEESLKDPLIALRTYRAVWKAVVSACDNAASHDDDPERMARARALDPRVAVFTAVGIVGA